MMSPLTGSPAHQRRAIALLFPFPEFTFDHRVVVGALTRVPARGEPGKRRSQAIEDGFPQPRVGKQESHRQTDKQCGYMLAARQEAQQAECKQAHHEGPAHGLRQQANQAQPAFADRWEPGEQDAQQQARHHAARTEMMGQLADDKVAGVGHRAGQGCEHGQDKSDRQPGPADRDSDKGSEDLRTPEVG
jgi:hypothetical protein